MASELDALKDIPGYKAILKSVLKSQIQLLIEQLSDQTGEESIILTASVNDGTLSHLGSSTGKGFLEGRDEIKSQFLGFCLKTHHRKKTQETRSPYQRSNIGAPRASPQHSSTKRPRIQPMPPQRQDPPQSYRSFSDNSIPHLDTDPSLTPGVDSSDNGQNQSFSNLVKQERTESGGEHQDNYNLSDTVSFPDSLQRSHTQTSADQSSAEAGQSADRSADESNDSASANIKVEPITENEMELEITGVEPGNTSAASDSWSQGQGEASYSSASGDPLNQSADQTDYNWIYGGMDKQSSKNIHLIVDNLEGAGRNFFNCTYCRKMFGSHSELVRHVRVHTGERPYKCDICSMAFSVKSSLTTHFRLHTGEKPYKCLVCQKGFASRSPFNYHKKTAHRSNNDGQLQQSADIKEEMGLQNTDNKDNTLTEIQTVLH